MSFLDRLRPSVAEQLRAVGMARTLDKGEVLLRQGELGRAIFLITKGSLEARVSGEVVNLCKPGDVVGEMAFLDGEPRSADLVATQASEVVVWSYDTMTRLVQRESSVHAALLESIARRHARSVRKMTEATVPTQGPEVVQLECGEYTPGERRIDVAEGDPIKLSPTESRLLTYLVSRPSRAIAYQTLLEEVWGYSSQVTSRTVYATVHRLRSKVEVDPSSPRHIISLSGEGYRFDP